MVSLFKCGCFIIIILICGDVINGLLFKDKFKGSFPLRLSLAYGLGTGVCGILMFYMSYFGFQLNSSNLFFLIAPFLLIFVLKLSRSYKQSLANVSIVRLLKKNGIVDYLIMLLIIVSLVLIIFKALFLPMHLADDRVQWGFKAKVLYHDQTIYSEDFFDPLRTKLQVSYPFLVPLLECGFFNFIGDSNDRLVKILFPSYFISLLLFFYASQRKYLSHRYALLFTSMLAVLPVFVKDIHGSPSSGYADIPLTFYYAVAGLSIFQWLRNNNWGDLFLAALFMGFAVFTKKEGMILWVIMVFVIGFYLLFIQKVDKINKFKIMAVFILLPLTILIPWFQFSSTLTPPAWERNWSSAYLTPDFISSHLYRILPILTKMKYVFLSAKYWNVLWITFFVVVACFPKRSFRFPQAFLLLTVGMNIFALFLSVLIYPWSWWFNFLPDMYRLFIINIPLVVYFISFQIYQTGLFKRRII